MNLRDLMNKLDTIAEADDARAQYDKFKADDAKAGAIAQVKKMLSPNGMQNFIDPKDGIVKWQEQMNGESGGPGSIREFPFDWYKKGQNADFFNILKTAGLELVPVDRKNLFGTSQVVGIKGGPQALADLGKPKPPTDGGGGKPTAGASTLTADAAALEALTNQLDALLGAGGGGKPDVKPPVTHLPPNPPPNWNPPINPKTKKPFSWGEFAAAVAAGAMPGAMVGGLPGAAITGTAGGAVDAYHQLHNESIAKTLAESFGYQLDDKQLNEVDINPFNGLSGIGGLGGSRPTSTMRVGGTNWTATAHDPNLFSNGQGATKTYQDLAKGGDVATHTAGDVEKIAAKTAIPIEKDIGTATAKTVAKTGAKDVIKKLIPGVGLVVGTIDAIKRAQEGDWKGAAMAGASGLLSLVPGVGTAASLGLDAANIYRDYKAGKFGGGDAGGSGGAPGGTTGGDQKLQQLQKIIGAKPDGLMGPETKAKLQAWQQKNGLTPDGMPGPQTYGKAGIKETTQTVAEGIRNLQERLALIETKATIKESIAGRRYFLDENCFMFDENGEQVTDLVTIAAINEAYVNGEVEVDEGIWSDIASGAAKYGKGAYDAAKDFGGALLKGGRNPEAAERLAKWSGVSGAKKAGLKTAATIAKNPIKSAAAATALGVGGAAALGGNSGNTPDTTNTGNGGGGVGGGGGGGSPADATDAVTPNAGAVDPKIADLEKQIKALMAKHGDDDQEAQNSPIWQQATSHAQAVIDKADKVNPAQTTADQQAAQTVKPGSETPTASTTTGAGGAGSPSGTTGVVPKKGPPDLDGKSQIPGVKNEDSSAELTRWLQIARG